jgi:hypothetical protein
MPPENENPKLDEGGATDGAGVSVAESGPETAPEISNDETDNVDSGLHRNDGLAQAESGQMVGNDPIASVETTIPDTKNAETDNVDSGLHRNDEPAPAVVSPKPSFRDYLLKAKEAISFRKKKKLDKILAEIGKKGTITNDEVEKLLHVSDKTAERYLSQLQKEQKIKTNGKKGKAREYLPI